MVALVIAEHDNASLKGSTHHTVTAAIACGGEVHILVAGSNCGAAVEAAAAIAGVTKVLVADAAYFADGLAENVAEQVLAVAGAYSHILAPATAYGKNILPRVAAKLDVAQISEITRSMRPTPSSARSTPATPSPPCNRATRSRSSPCAVPALTPQRPPVGRLPSRRSLLSPIRASRVLLAANWPSRTVPS